VYDFSTTDGRQAAPPTWPPAGAELPSLCIVYWMQLLLELACEMHASCQCSRCGRALLSGACIWRDGRLDDGWIVSPPSTWLYQPRRVNGAVPCSEMWKCIRYV